MHRCGLTSGAKENEMEKRRQPSPSSFLGMRNIYILRTIYIVYIFKNSQNVVTVSNTISVWPVVPHCFRGTLLLQSRKSSDSPIVPRVMLFVDFTELRLSGGIAHFRVPYKKRNIEPFFFLMHWDNMRLGGKFLN